MDTKAWFEDWFNSPYYHQLYFNRDDREAEAFIDHLVDHLKIPSGSKLLDVACGKGRHSIHLASQGFDVTGIDLSPDSIMLAKQEEKENLHFFMHDMRLPFWINYFDYAFNFFTSFGYFHTRREDENAIRTIAQSLRYDGYFVIDYLNVHYAEDHLQHVSDVEIEDINFHITKWFDEDFFYKKITVEDPTLSEPETYQEKVAKFTLGDFTDMLSFHEMQVQEVFGNYDLSPYHVRNSPRMIIIAKKVMKKK